MNRKTTKKQRYRVTRLTNPEAPYVLGARGADTIHEALFLAECARRAVCEPPFEAFAVIIDTRDGTVVNEDELLLGPMASWASEQGAGLDKQAWPASMKVAAS